MNVAAMDMAFGGGGWWRCGEVVIRGYFNFRFKWDNECFGRVVRFR